MSIIVNKKSNSQKPRVTDDFSFMINIIILNSLGFFFLDFLVPYVASQELNATGTDMGIIFSVITIGFLINSPFVGFLTDKISKKVLVFIGSVGRGIAYLIFYFAIIIKSLYGLALGMFSLGFFAAFFWIPLNTLIAEKSSKEHRSYAYGRKESATGIGTFFGGFIGFSILMTAAEITPDNPFFIYSALIIFGLANLYAGIIFFIKVDESIKFSEEKEENFGDNSVATGHFTSRGILLGLILLFIVLLLSSTNGSLAKPFLNVYLLEMIENDITLATLAFIPSGIVSMLLAPKLGEIVDRINPYLGISLASIFGALVTFALINTSSLLIFAILLTIDVTIVITGLLIMSNFISRVSKTHRGKLFGFKSTFENFGAIFGPLLGGIVWDLSGPKSPFIISIVVELALIPFFIIAIFFLKPYLVDSGENAKQNC